MDGQINLNGETEYTEIPRAEKFRAECERLIVEKGTGYINCKDRIIGYYNDGQLTVEVLKREYNKNRFSVDFSDGVLGIFEANDDGIDFYKRKETVSFKWERVLEIIKTAIREGKYVNKRLARWE